MCKKGMAKIIRDSCHALEHVGLLGEELDLFFLEIPLGVVVNTENAFAFAKTYIVVSSCSILALPLAWLIIV